MHRIVEGNSFELIIIGQEKTGGTVENIDLSPVDELAVYLVKAGRGRKLMAYTINEAGEIVMSVDAAEVSKGIYGVEVIGKIEDTAIHAQQPSAFQIVDGYHRFGDAGAVMSYEVNIVMIYNTAANMRYVDAAVAAEAEARQAADEALGERIDNAGKVDDVLIDGVSILDPDSKKANIPTSMFGKVDDVKVNGISVLNPQTKEAIIDTALVFNKQNNVNGKGTTVLKGDSTFASQLTEQNTIYIVRHDFDLDGQEVTIPASCVLRFDGGSVSNGTVIGADTCIDAGLEKIFGEDVIISGTWNVGKIYDDWFNIDTSTLGNIEAMNNDDTHVDVYINNRLEYGGVFHIHSNTNVWLNGTLVNVGDSDEKAFISCNGKKNISVYGGEIIGNKAILNSGGKEDAHGVALRGCSGVKLVNVKLRDIDGDGIYIGRKINTEDVIMSDNIVVSGCSIINAGRNGIGIVGVKNCVVENTMIDTVTGHKPLLGIDFEPNDNDSIENVTVKNVTIRNCDRGVGFVRNSGTYYFNNILLEGVDVAITSGWQNSYGISINNIPNLIVRNCKFDVDTSYSISNGINANSTNSTCLFEGCTFIVNKPIRAVNAIFKGCSISSSSTAVFELTSGSKFYDNIISGTAFNQKCTAGFVMKGNVITANTTAGIPAIELNTSTQSATVQNILIENNTFTVNNGAYFMRNGSGNPLKNMQIRYNVFNLTCTDGSRTLININNASDCRIHDNIINLESNNSVFSFDSSNNIHVSRNTFNDPDGYSKNHHAGINTKLLQTNMAGDMIFDLDTGKPLWFNGTSWVDANGNALT